MGKNNKWKRKKYNFNKKSNILQFDNDVQYLLHCKRERLSDPTVSPEELELLNRKVRLDDGKLGYVFTISKFKQSWIYTCHSCKARNMTRQELKAHILTQKHLGKMKMTVHLHHKFVLKEEKTFTQSEEIANEEQTTCEIQKVLDEFQGPLVGLEYILEISQKKVTCPRYFCLLCSREETKETLLHHLTNSNHQMKFLMMFFPSAAEKIKSFKRYCYYNAYIRLCTHITTSIQHVHGRLKPRQIESKDFSHRTKWGILDKIDRSKHIRESKDNKFMSCVDLKHFEPGGCPVLAGTVQLKQEMDPITFIKTEPLEEEKSTGNAGDRGFAGQQNTDLYNVPFGYRSFQDNASSWSRTSNRFNDVNESSYSGSLRNEIKERNTRLSLPSEQQMWDEGSYKPLMLPKVETFSDDNRKSSELVAVLRELLKVKNYLGSLEPKVQDLLEETLSRERVAESYGNDLIFRKENYVFLETIKEKFVGFLEVGVCEPKLVNLTNKITALFNNANRELTDVDSRTSNFDEQPNKYWSRRTNVRETRTVRRNVLKLSDIPTFIENQYSLSLLPFTEKEKLSAQVCSYLNDRNKFEVTEDEILQIVHMILNSSCVENNSKNYRSKSYETSQPGSSIDFDLIHEQMSQDFKAYVKGDYYRFRYRRSQY